MDGTKTDPLPAVSVTGSVLVMGGSRSMHCSMYTQSSVVEEGCVICWSYTDVYNFESFILVSLLFSVKKKQIQQQQPQKRSFFFIGFVLFFCTVRRALVYTRGALFISISLLLLVVVVVVVVVV